MILQVEGGNFAYRDKPILKDISFELENDEIMTILGPNGVGKTTLLKCLMGFLKWSSGKTRISGRALDSYSSRELWKKISYVPQAKRSVFSYRVLDMVVMGLDVENGFFHIPKKEQFRKAEEMLEKLGIGKLAERYCSELSGGELQMVMMARALVSKPQLLILDEPESNLDVKNQLKILKAIEQANKEMNTACVINTHFPDHALKISHQTLLLGYGHKKLFGPTKSLITEENVERFFQVKSKIFSFKAEDRYCFTIAPYEISQE